MSAGRHRGAYGIQYDALPTVYEYLKQSGARFVGSGRWQKTLCPFHDDTRPSLSVNRDGDGFRCHVCDSHGGNVLAFLSMRDGMHPAQVALMFGAIRRDPAFGGAP